MKQLNDLVKYFDDNDHVESLVISFLYRQNKQEFELVSDFVNWNLPPGQREFRKVIFFGIDEYKRINGNIAKYVNATISYHISDFTGSNVLQGVYVSEENDKCTVHLYLGINFGSVVFTCSSFEMSSRIGQGFKELPGDWSYVDLDTNEEFLFTQPFANE